MKDHTVDFFENSSDLKSKIGIKLKDLYPDILNQVFQLINLECSLNRFKIEKENWVVFIGHYGNTLVEIYSGIADVEVFPIPDSVIKGKMLKNHDSLGNTRVDFQFTDKYGYNKTIEGIQHKFHKQISTYDAIINELFRKELPIKEIIKIINKMDLHDLKEPATWKKGIINALKKFT